MSLTSECERLYLCGQVFEEALKTWLERQKMSESMSSVSEHDLLSHVENNILLDFVDVAESLIRRSASTDPNTNPNLSTGLSHL